MVTNLQIFMIKGAILKIKFLKNQSWQCLSWESIFGKCLRWLQTEMTVGWDDWWLGWLLISLTVDWDDCRLGWLPIYFQTKLFTTSNKVKYLSCLNRALTEYQFCRFLYDTKKQLNQDCVLKPQHGPLLTLRLNCQRQGNHDKKEQEEV